MVCFLSQCLSSCIEIDIDSVASTEKLVEFVNGDGERFHLMSFTRPCCQRLRTHVVPGIAHELLQGFFNVLVKFELLHKLEILELVKLLRIVRNLGFLKALSDTVVVHAFGRLVGVVAGVLLIFDFSNVLLLAVRLVAVIGFKSGLFMLTRDVLLCSFDVEDAFE